MRATGRQVVAIEDAPSHMPHAVRPFLKWAGGKRQLLPELIEHCPTENLRASKRATYFEPFLGGGALFFALRPMRAVLTDFNERLIRTYLGVRDNVDDVIERLHRYQRQHSRNFFYATREKEIDRERDNAAVAAWFIYLNKAGYNGLYRVNRANQFNVPVGRYDKPNICDQKTLRACSSVLARAEIHKADFRDVKRRAIRGDFVYFDPPYIPLSMTSSFTAYTAHGFTNVDQKELRNVARQLIDAGVGVLLSNSSAKAVADLYREDFQCIEVGATRSVNSNASRRGEVNEFIIVPRER